MSDMRNTYAEAALPGLAGEGWFQHTVDGAVVIYLAGELDLCTARELDRRLQDAVDCAGAGTLLVDLRRVDFIDARSVGLMVQAWGALRQRGGTLQVRCLSGVPARVFDALDLYDTLVCPSDADNYQGQSR